MPDAWERARNDGRSVGYQVANKGLDPSDVTDDPSYLRAIDTGTEAVWWEGYHEAREEPPEETNHVSRGAW